jgi:glycosyltransferase involved in cell wall biosynthesis
VRPLHVLHIIGGGDTGGAMSHLLPLLSALRRTGCDVHLLCLGEGGLAEQARRRGLSVAVLPMNGARDPRVLRPLRRLLAAGPEELEAERSSAPGGGRGPAARGPAARWDVVHTHGMRANLPVRLIAPGLRRRPCLFTTVHSDLRLDYESARLARLYAGMDRATLGWVDRIICVSESLRDLLAERGYPAEQLVTVYSGLEPDGSEAGSTGKTTPGAARNSEAVAFPVMRPDRTAELPPVAASPARRLRVGAVARLVAVKDIDLMLEVAQLLRQTHPEVEVVVVGDGPERERLEALATGAGLAEVVRFTGRLEDVGPILRQLDIYMVTSVFEGGVSMSVLEAMESGLPVVTTAAGGVAEVVVDGQTGYVVKRDRERGALAAALADRAAALLDDPVLRARMGAAGTRRVRERFAIEQTAAQTLRVYERCLAARGGHF